ncbi:MAG TPA: hypothetical protein VJ124_10370 [Pyrinomonadaceae bacterium]|nr:hypothetical protein [Pyrinomonadaceae bacterium]
MARKTQREAEEKRRGPKRVPQMQEELMIESLRTRGLNIAFVEGEENIKEPEQRSVQRPKVFYRRELEALPLIVAKPQAAPQ